MSYYFIEAYGISQREYGRQNMAVKNNRNQVKHLKSGGPYSFEELRFLRLDDGTTVVLVGLCYTIFKDRKKK